MNILDYVSIGSNNARTIEELMKLTHCSNRRTRKQIEDAKKHSTITNLSDGNGYFIPSIDELMLQKEYVRQEESRAQAILDGVAFSKIDILRKESERNDN